MSHHLACSVFVKRRSPSPWMPLWPQHIASGLSWPTTPDSVPYILLLVCLQPTPPRPLYIYPVPICCQQNVSFKKIYMSDSWALNDIWHEKLTIMSQWDIFRPRIRRTDEFCGQTRLEIGSRHCTVSIWDTYQSIGGNCLKEKTLKVFNH